MRKGKNSSITFHTSLEDDLRHREQFDAIMKELKPVYFAPEKKFSWTARIWIHLKMRREASKILSTRLYAR